MRRRFVLASLCVGAASPVLATLPPSPDSKTVWVHFQFGSTEIDNKTQQIAGIVGLTKYPYGGPIKIVGHTSKDEGEGMALSLARARALRDRLIEFGARPEQFVSIEGIADRQPFGVNEPNIDAHNRRAEIFLVRL